MSWRSIHRELTRSFRKTRATIQKTESSKPEQLSPDLKQNELLLKGLFQDCGDISFHHFCLMEQRRAFLIYQPGLVDRKTLNDSILRPLLEQPKLNHPNLDLAALGGSVIHSIGQEIATEIAQIIEGILSGKTALLMDGAPEALLIETTGLDKRAIEEPKAEIATRGPRDSFIEILQVNIALVRQRIKDSRLKFIFFPAGRRSKTKIALAYIAGVTPEDLLQEAIERLMQVDMDIILDSGYVEQMIEDKWYSIFPQLQLTERPDEVVAALNEGRVAIFTDTSPGVLMAPATLNTLMHSADDYYNRWIIGSFIRGFRFFASIFSIVLPALYVSLTSYHPDLLPAKFALAVAGARQNIPFPAFLEAFILEAFIELIREAGLRLPGNLGQAVSIVGGLIIGQAAVSANLVSPVMLTVVGLTAISNFSIPNFDAAQAVRVIRFLLMILAAFLGLYGVVLGIITIFIHLAQLTSFNYSYLSPWAPLQPSDLKDSIIRLPWPAMRWRPQFLRPRQKKRLQDRRKEDPNDY
ncbi:MAG: spore germination protein [Firmicutes bacterium]|nr:spore germination protein [Bacillota bacterium]